MKTLAEHPPVVLVFSAHDPSGAAGIQADIESINRNGARCVSVLTATTTQNTSVFEAIQPLQATDFRHQAALLLADIQVNAIKIGLTGSVTVIDEIARVIKKAGSLPVVLDPVLHAGTGAGLATNEIIASLKQQLLPLTTILTPNVQEALQLTGASDADSAARTLLDLGCQQVLITGADTPTTRVINTLYRQHSEPLEFTWERLPGVYHGSGCTLAAAIAALLAQGVESVEAVTRAQQFCWNSLKYHLQLGKSQFHPDRNLQDRT